MSFITYDTWEGEPSRVVMFYDGEKPRRARYVNIWLDESNVVVPLNRSSNIDVTSLVHYPTVEDMERVSKILRGLDSRPDLWMLFNRVREVLKTHITFNTDADATLIALWILASHFYPVFNAFPILYIGKPGYAAGGTTLASLVLALSPRPCLVVNPTEAGVRRLIFEYAATIAIDEFRLDTVTDQKLGELAVLLDGGFHKQTVVPRAYAADSVRPYKIYGPKIVVDPEGTIERMSTLSRGVRIGLRPDPTRNEIPDVALYAEKYSGLIHDLYVIYLPYAHEVYVTYMKILALQDSTSLH